MANYRAAIRLAGDTSSEAVDPGRFVVNHHLTERAELDLDVLSGGHLLHLAVAGCLFNDIVRAAAARTIQLSDLQVSAAGGFAGDGSTGITYAVEIAGDASEGELRQLVADCEDAAAIPLTLVRGTTVEASEIVVHGDV